MLLPKSSATDGDFLEFIKSGFKSFGASDSYAAQVGNTNYTPNPTMVLLVDLTILVLSVMRLQRLDLLLAAAARRLITEVKVILRTWLPRLIWLPRAVYVLNFAQNQR
jgi:hypothetical protein